MTRIRYGMLLRGAIGGLFLLGTLSSSAPAAAGIAESDVKAAFVLNFIKFVEWPSSAFDSPEAPIVLSVLGNDPVAHSLASLDGRTVSGRRIVFRKVPALSALERCHLLFVGASGKAGLKVNAKLLYLGKIDPARSRR